MHSLRQCLPCHRLHRDGSKGRAIHPRARHPHPKLSSIDQKPGTNEEKSRANPIQSNEKMNEFTPRYVHVCTHVTALSLRWKKEDDRALLINQCGCASMHCHNQLLVAACTHVACISLPTHDS
uniref:Uncharacterized protein n=1 Tax=Lotharella globosa TaxID=91324 RepID=A0A7S3Z4A2_9EUKA